MSSKNSKSSRLYILSFIVPFAVAMIGLIMGGFAPFGAKDIMTASGHESMIPFYHELYDRFHNGTVFAFNYNNGYSFSKVFLYYMSDPLNLVMLILPKSAMLGCMSVLYAVKIGLAGLFASIFFKYRKTIALFNKVEMEDTRAEEIAEYEAKLKAKRDKAREKNKNKKDFKIGGSEAPKTKFGTWLANLDIYTFILAVAYALSSYMITEGANIAFTGAVALFPLVLLEIEKLIAEKHWLTYVIAFTLTIYANIYIAMIEFVFMLIYVPTREYHTLREGIAIVIRKLFLDILAIGAGCIVIFNAFTGSVFHTDFSLNFPAYNPMANIADSFSEMMYGTLPSTVNDFINNADLYAGVFVLFLLVIYVFNSNINVYSRIKNTLIMFILFIGTVFPTANHFLNVFRNTPYFYTTFGFLFIIMFLIIAQDALTNIEYIKSWQVTVSFFIVIGLTAYSMMFSTVFDSPNPYLYTMELMVLYFIILFMWKNNSMTRLVFDVLIGIIMLAEICSAFPKSLSLIGTSAKEYTYTNVNIIENATDYIKETYDPSNTARIVFYDSNRTNIEPVSEMISGIKYVISEEGTPNMDFNLTKIDSVYGLDIYENEYYIEQGASSIDVPADVLQNYESMPYESINELTDYLLKDIPHESIYQTAPILSDDITVEELMVLKKDGSPVLTSKTYQYSLGSSLSGDLYGYSNFVIHIGEVYPYDEVSAIQTLNNKDNNDAIFYQRYYSLNKETYQLLYDQLNKRSSENKGVSDYTMFFPTEMPETIALIVLDFFVSLLSILIIVLLTKEKQKNSLESLNLLLEKYADALSGFLNKYKVYILNIVITSGLFISYLMISRIMPFGPKTIIISDSYVAYYPSLTSTFIGFFGRIGNLNMESIGFSSLLFGAGKLPLELYLNPLNWPLVLFSRENALNGVTFVFFLRFILTGPSLIFYLTHRHERKLNITDFRLIPASIAYSLCSFFSAYFIFYIFFDVALMLPFMIWALEGLIYKKEFKKYIILLSFTIFINQYNAVLLCEFLLLYFFTFKFDSIKDFFAKGIRFALTSVLAAVIASYTLYPLFKTLLNSAYLINGKSSLILDTYSQQSSSVVPAFSLSNTMIGSFRELIPFTNFNLVDADFSKANTYAGLLLLFFLAGFIFNTKIQKSERIKKTIIMALLYISYGNEFLNFVFHGFHRQNKVPNRFAFILIFMVIVAFVDSFYVFEELKKKKAFIILSVTSLLIVALTLISNANYESSSKHISIIFTIILTAIYAACIVKIINNKKLNKTLIYSMITLLLVVELISTDIYNAARNNGRYIHALDNSNRYISKIANEQEYKKEINRVEYFSSGKVMELVNNENMADIYGISCFSSTITEPYLQAFNYLSVPTKRNLVLYGNGNPLTNTFFNVKAQVYDPHIYKGTIPSYMEEASNCGTVKMYESPYNLSIGFNIPNTESINDLHFSDYDNVIDYHNEISNHITGKDLYSEYTLVNEKYANNSGAGNNELIWYITTPNDQEFKDALLMDKSYEYSIEHDIPELNRITSNNTIITIKIPKDLAGDIYIGNKRFINYEITVEGNRETHLELPFFYYVVPGKTELECIQEQLQNYKIAVLNKDVLSEFHDSLAEGCLKNISYDNTRINGDITISEPGTVYFSIPYLDGFTAYVDGKKVDIVEYFGAIGIPIDDIGDHTIVLEYHVPGLKTGIILSLSGIVIFILLLILQRKLSNKPKEKEEADG